MIPRYSLIHYVRITSAESVVATLFTGSYCSLQAVYKLGKSDLGVICLEYKAK